LIPLRDPWANRELTRVVRGAEWLSTTSRLTFDRLCGPESRRSYMTPEGKGVPHRERPIYLRQRGAIFHR